MGAAGDHVCRCWAKIPFRSGKAVLEKLKSSECRFGRLAEDGLNLRTRVRTFGGGEPGLSVSVVAAPPKNKMAVFNYGCPMVVTPSVGS